jgi:hypothetical protein
MHELASDFLALELLVCGSIYPSVLATTGRSRAKLSNAQA